MFVLVEKNNLWYNISMFNKPPRKQKLYAVIDTSDIVGIFPTKKLAKEIASTDKKIVELSWTGGFYTTEKNNIQNVSHIPVFDF